MNITVDMSELNRDFYKNMASKIFGIPYDEVTVEHRAEAKNLLMNYFYGRSDTIPFKSEVKT